jgi:hypothetical protein
MTTQAAITTASTQQIAQAVNAFQSALNHVASLGGFTASVEVASIAAGCGDYGQDEGVEVVLSVTHSAGIQGRHFAPVAQQLIQGNANLPDFVRNSIGYTNDPGQWILFVG